MKKYIAVILLWVSLFSIPSYSQSVYSPRNASLDHLYPKITQDVINRLTNIYLSENYKECYDSCEVYIRHYDFGHEKHPFKDRRKILGYFDRNNLIDIATILQLSCVSAYNYSLNDVSKIDTWPIFWGMQRARSCATICYDYLREFAPNNYSTAQTIEEYIRIAETGLQATKCGEHFLHIMGEDKWANKELKWFYKTSDNILKVLVKNISDLYTTVEDYPLLKYKINKFITTYKLIQNDYSSVNKLLSERIENFRDIISLDTQGEYKTFIYSELNSLSSLLCSLVIESDWCKKIGNDFERFCMENLIKLNDISYYLNGSSRYSMNIDYTLQDIQDQLKETDCAMIHFEAPIASGRLFSRYDLGTLHRNYALLITKNQVTPEVWHRGFISNDTINDLSAIKEQHPNIERYFFVGTPRMAFVDIAGKDPSIVRLHSLSQLLQPIKDNNFIEEISFIGNINYTEVGEISNFSDSILEIASNSHKTKGERGDKGFDQLQGPVIELEYIKSLYNNVRSISGDSASKAAVVSEIRRNRGALHISTHGELFDRAVDFNISPEDLILKNTILDNSCLILSGYNDSPHSPSTVLSGRDVFNLRRINSSIVFLDACFSGGGAIGVSGAVGMAEAFHLIGATNVICYLEPIEDEIATEFSNLFYSELAKGSTCHDSFFNAKKSLNKNIKAVLWE